MTSDFFLELQGVTKQYDQHLAVDNVSLQIPRGRIYAMLGPNGAGKTTTIRMITGITMPDRGQIMLEGRPLRPADSRKVGYMPEERGLYKKAKVREQVIYLLELKGLKAAEARLQADTWIERLGLGEWAGKQVTDLSKGMQQKVQFIATVAHDPHLLILDEPFSGLDPVNAKLIEQEILRLKAAGTTIIFSTHRMEQVEEFCDDLVLIHRGRVVIEGNVVDVRRRFQKHEYVAEFVGDPAEVQRLGAQVVEGSLTDTRVLLRVEEAGGTRALLRALSEIPVEWLRVARVMPRLSDIFIELVGETAGVAARRPEAA